VNVSDLAVSTGDRWTTTLAENRRRAHRCILWAFLALSLAGCSSGGNEGGKTDPPPSARQVTISGLVQKGLFTELQVQAYALDPVDLSLGEPVAAAGTADGQGYSVTLEASQLVLLEASGSFISESSGETMLLDAPLLAIVDTSGSTSSTANINMFSTLEASRFLALADADGTDGGALLDESRELLNTALGLPSGTVSTDLDFNAIESDATLSDPDLQLLLLSAALVTSSGSTELFSGGFGVIVDSFSDATALDYAVMSFGALEGLSAQYLYDLSTIYSGYDLPQLELPDGLVLDCAPGSTCEFTVVAGPTVTASSPVAREGDGEARVHIRLSEAAAGEVQVAVRSVDGSALAGFDYAPVDTVLTFAPGQLQVEVLVPLVLDAIREDDEQFGLVLDPLNTGWGAARRPATVWVSDARPAQRDRDTRQLRVEALCALGVGPVEQLRLGPCPAGTAQGFGFPTGDAPALGVALDLAVDCAASGDCPPLRDEWLVELYLVADAANRPVAEQPLGTYIYPVAALQRLSDAPRPRALMVSLAPERIIGLAEEAVRQGWFLRLEARIGSAPSLLASASIGTLLPLPTTVTAGGIEVPLGQVYSLDPSGGSLCGDGPGVALDADFVLGEFFGVTVPGRGEVCILLDTTPEGVKAELVGGKVDLSAATITLPAGHGVVLGGSFPLPVFLAGSMRGISGQETWLYYEGWPFMLRIDDAQLNRDGVELRYGRVRSLVDVDYSERDPRARANGGPHSNDAWYHGASAGSVFLGPEGLRGTVQFADGSGRTAFPRAEASWQAFAQELRNSEFVGVTTLPLQFRMRQSKACSEPDCRAAREAEYAVQAAGAALDGRGFVLGKAASTTALAPAWGAHPGGGDAFTRPEDLPAGAMLHLALPGHRLPASQPAGDFLQAHLAPASAGGWLVVHPVSSRAYQDGNHHPIGLSIGPELYRAPATGAPGIGEGRSLAGLALVLDNRAEAVTLPTSVGAKYVLRNAGVTGVFNVEPAALGQPVPFSGYPLEFNRFAFRLVDNTLDAESWMDGRLRLSGEFGGPSGQVLHFGNLGLNCAARLGRMVLDWEACDGIDNDGDGEVDENCGFQLHSWRAPGQLYSARFDGAQSCTADAQSLALWHDLRFGALNGPVSFETRWDAAGKLLDSTASLAAQYRLDRIAGREETGFTFRPGAARLVVDRASSPMIGRGAFQFESATIGVPFWDALVADIRVANRSASPDGAVIPEESVVLKAGSLTAAHDSLNNPELRAQAGPAAVLTAAYAWGATGFRFDLPVRFRSLNNDLDLDLDAVPGQSRFVGDTRRADLFVMDTERVVNFIEPRRTKLTFGASAKLAELGNVSFQLDLDNPDTLARVDALLVSLGILSRPVLEPSLRGVQESVFMVNRLAGQGLEDVMRASLERGIEELGAAAASLTPDGRDPFVSASEALAAVNSLPGQLLDLVEQPLRRPVEQAIGELEASLRDRLRETRDALLVLPGGDTAGPALLAELDAARQLVGDARSQLARADSGVTVAVREATDLTKELQSQATRLQFAVLEVDRILQRAVRFTDASCRDGFIPGAELNGYLEEVIGRFVSVRRLLGYVEGAELFGPLVELLARDPDVQRRVRGAQQELARHAEELGGFLAEADLALRSVVCSGDVDLALVRARQLTGEISQAASTAYGAARLAQQRLGELQEQLGVAVSAIREPLDQLGSALDYLATQLDGPVNRPGSAFLFEIESWLQQGFSDPQFRLVAESAAERDVVSLLAGPARIAIDTLFASLREELNAIRPLPGAYATPAQLRSLLVAEVMASGPVRELQVAMSRYFDEIAHQVTGLSLGLTDQLNFAIRKAVASVESEVNGVLDSALAPVRNMPLKALDIDGFAVIAGNELERVHVGAQWELGSITGQDPTRFGAALDAVRWGARNGIGSCGVAGGASRIDVTVSGYGLPLGIAGGDLTADRLYLGFTLEPSGRTVPPLDPRGLFGGIDTSGKIGIGSVSVNDPGLAAGIGDVQNYLGARAGAMFGDFEAEAAFLVGRTCPGNDVLTELDPEIGRFISIPATGFAGVYARGGVTMPIIPGGCLLNVSARADFGAWALAGAGLQWGGMVGGAGFGQVACIGALRGQVMAIGERLGNGQYRFLGNGFGVAGAGSCEPETWTSVARSREDSWCGTGDAEFTLSFDGRWRVLDSAVDWVF
jgi:hypothetical protein